MIKKLVLASVIFFINLQASEDKPKPAFQTINFIHIPKTGGLTLYALLKSNFSDKQVYPWSVSNVWGWPKMSGDPKDILQNFPPINHKFAGHHLPFWFFLHKDLNFKNAFFVTVLREPVERVISNFYYWKKYFPLNSFYDIPFNLICKFLASNPYLEGEELLEDAKKTVARMDHIIFFDNFDQGVRDLFRKLNLELEDIPITNTTEKPPVDEIDIELIREWNDLDVRLYEYAKEKYGLDPIAE